MVNSRLSFFNKPNGEYPLDAEVFDIGHQNIIIGLSWLQNQGFSLDIPNSRLINN